jgi:hypothetical protein
MLAPAVDEFVMAEHRFARAESHGVPLRHSADNRSDSIQLLIYS